MRSDQTGIIAILSIFLAACTVISCSSRYRLDLYLTADEERGKVKVETTEFVKEAIIGGRLPAPEILPGDGNVAIITVGRRARIESENSKYALTFDEHLQSKLFLQLPSRLQPEQWSLVGRSAVRLLGRYELTPEQKSFRPVDGAFGIDSLKGDDAYLSVDGTFENADGKVIRFDGQFKMRIRD